MKRKKRINSKAWTMRFMSQTIDFVKFLTDSFIILMIRFFV